MKNNNDMSPESILAQAGHYIDEVTGGIVPPIQLSSTFARDENYEYISEHSYSRSGNPSWQVLEQLCARLDGGVDALCFGSGMAAIAALFETLDSGQHVVAPRVMYHGAQDWLRRISQKRPIGLDLFDAADIENLSAAVRPGETAIVWIETPVNPTWEVIDIQAAADMAHAAGAILAVDATVATPLTTRALELGADLVFHSATKYLNGHSDVLAGILVTARDDERWQDIRLVRTLTGGILGPLEAWLLLRGMRTMALRVERAAQNAMRLASHFESDNRLEAVLYPGLESHPGHEIAVRQMRNGFGGMLSLLVRGGAQEAKAIAAGLRLFVSATSLGGVESLVEHRASIEGPHSAVPPNLLRFSIGIENCEELIADLEQSLNQVYPD